MRSILLLLCVALTGCKNLTPEQNDRLFDAGMRVGGKLVARFAK